MIEEAIRHSAADLEPGAKLRVYCPFCNAQDEKSLSIQRDMYKPHLLWFRCFRGKCGENGRVVDQAGTRMVLHAARLPENPDKHMPQYRDLPPKFLDMVSDKYDIPNGWFYEQGCRYDPENEGIVMPWANHKNQQFGWIHKQFREGVPKSKHDNSLKLKTRLGWPNAGVAYAKLPPTAIGILVEGLMDAYKVLHSARVINLPIYPVALNGANLYTEDAKVLSKVFSSVLVLMDPDLWPSGAIEVLHKLRPWNIRTAATSLEQDPKDTPPDELQAWLATVREFF